MLIGVPKEIKNHEYRVGVTPPGAQALTAAGHDVRVQTDAGTRVGFADADYQAAGAHLVEDAAAVYGADLVVKVKELQPVEYSLLRAGQILFCYHHFAPDRELLQAMLDARVSCVAYETVTASDGSLPLLVPMSQIAGRLAPQVGAWALQMANGGSGLLLGGVPGVPPARVVIIGGGTVGQGAARIAIGMGADVTLLDRDPVRLAHLEELFGARLKTVVSSARTLAPAVHDADLVIGAVLQPGKLAPKLIRREDLKRMRAGSVIVDVAIDQGGIAETSRPTTHTDPVYVEDAVVHYCVPNMPSAVARTATVALTQATLPFALKLASLGLKNAVTSDRRLLLGLQVHAGRVTHADLARDTGREYVEALALLV
ncbi:MAG: alanine dehydrogenase [Burkholderiales bacterium]